MSIEIVDNPDGTKTIQVRGNTSQRFSIEGILATYENIKIKFLKTKEPLSHVGFSEFSFGNMKRFQSDSQDGTSTMLEHIDPLLLQSYASRIDFTLFGIRDTDVSAFSRVAVSVNMRNNDGEPASFDLGTFFVTSVRPIGTDKTMITAEDIRTIIDKNTVSMTITTVDSIRDKLIDMLTELNVGHWIDSSIDVHPTLDVVYEDVSPIKVLTDVSSRFGIPISIGPNGEVFLIANVSGGRGVCASNIMAWAASETSEIKHNMFTFNDGFIYDKRIEQTLPPIKFNVSNSFFVTHNDRLGILDKIDENLLSNTVVVETTGDMRIETGDEITIETRDGEIKIDVTSVENRIGTSYRQKITGLTREVVLRGA